MLENQRLKARLDAVTGMTSTFQPPDASHVQDSSDRASSSTGRPPSDMADASQPTGTDTTATSRSGLVSPDKPFPDNLPDPASQLEASVDPSSNTTTEDDLPPDPSVPNPDSKTYSAVASAGQASTSSQDHIPSKVTSPPADTMHPSSSSASLPKTPHVSRPPGKKQGSGKQKKSTTPVPLPPANRGGKRQASPKTPDSTEATVKTAKKGSTPPNTTPKAAFQSPQVSAPPDRKSVV